MLDTATLCKLCNTSIKNAVYSDENHPFCCAGCRAVYYILTSQGALENYQTHPVFQRALEAGLITNSEMIQSQTVYKEIDRFYLEIQNMWCPSCAEIIRLLLLKRTGIQQCHVDYCTDLAMIEYAPRYISKEKILQFIQEIGYHPVPIQDAAHSSHSFALTLRFIVAAFFSLNTMMFAYPIYASYFHIDENHLGLFFAWVSLGAACPVLTYSAWPIWRRLYVGLKAGMWGMELLVCLGIGVAFLLSVYELYRGRCYVYFDSMTVIIAFVLLGKMLESKAKFSAKETVLRLTRSLPRRGRKRCSNGSESFVPLKEIDVGDCIVVLTGEKIVLDGIVVQGKGICNEALMTGESLPIEKKEGSAVLAGSIVQQGHLLIQVTATLEETFLSRLVTWIDQDMHHKTHYVRAIDVVIKWFVPCILCIASLTAIIVLWTGIQDDGQTSLQTALLRASAVLLISCPCAVGIAAPIAEAQLLNALAKVGAIVRNRGCLRFLGQETTWLFDKTGTVTQGQFKVLQGLECLSFNEQTCVKALTQCSNHPLAMAIYQTIWVPAAPFEKIEEIVGQGIQGVYQGHHYYLGSASFLENQGIHLPLTSLCNTEIVSYVFFAKDHACLTYFVLGDAVRPEIGPLIAQLTPIHTALISGDHAATVKNVADQCHFTRWEACCQPLQKKQIVNQLREKGHVVGFVGDGVNDAPALANAHVSISVISAADISIQVSDILLTTSLAILPRLRYLGCLGRRIVKQNIFWAFFYNGIGIILAVGGFLTPLFAAVAMVISSLIVIFNAQRIK